MGDGSDSCLEMRCSADEAWYDGTLNFASDSKDEIVVHFNDFDEEEDETIPSSYLLDPEKLKSRVRVRSEQLQDFQCKLVNENLLICGCLDYGAARRYYDAKVVSIVKRQHSYSDDGEVCKCNFILLWRDGPKKGKQTVVGCPEVCFLSNDAPEDDTMVKNLVKSLGRKGEQRRKPAAPKTTPSPRPRTPSPRLEIVPSKKQVSKGSSPTSLEHHPWKKLSSSKDHPPTSTLLNHTVLLGQQASEKSVGSKKKRIMQLEVVEQPDRSSDNDNLSNLDTDARPTSTPKDRSCEVFKDIRGHGNESGDSELRGGGGGSTKKGCIPVEKKRLVKVKTSKAVDALAPEVVVRDEAAAVRQEDDAPGTVRKRVKSNTKNLATPDVAAPCEEAAVVRKDYDVVARPFKGQVKFNTSEKKTTSDVVATRDEAAAVREDDIPHSYFKERETSNTKNLAKTDIGADDHEAISLSCGERVKLKSLERSKLVEASPQKMKQSELTSQKKKPEVIPQKRRPAVLKASQQNVGMQTVGKRMKNNLKQVQFGSRLSSKLDEATAPGTPSRPYDNAEAEPKEHLQEPTEHQKPKACRPKKRPLRKSVQQSLPSKKQPVRRCSKEQSQNSQQEEVIDTVNAKKQQTSNPVTKKNQRPEEPLAVIPDTDDIGSHKSAKEGVGTLDEPQHVTNQARGNKDRKRKEPSGPEQQQPPQSGDEALSQKSKSVSNDKDQSDIDMRYGSNHQPLREYSVEKSSEAIETVSPESSEELTASPPRVSNEIQENVRVTKFGERRTQTEINANGKKRRRSRVVTDDDEEEDDVQAPAKNVKNLEKKGKEVQSGSENSSANSQDDDCTDLKTTFTESSEELIASPPRVSNETQENVRVTEFRAPRTQTEINANGKKRERNLDDEADDDVQAPAKNLKNLKNLEKKGKEVQYRSADSSANSQDDDCTDPKTTCTSALDEEDVVEKQRNDDVKATELKLTRLLLLSNMETDVSAHDAMLLLQEHTEGVCAVHVLPVAEFQSSTVGYALYRDSGSALKAFLHLASKDRFVVSPKGRPWIVSQSADILGPHLCGFAARTAFKSDDSGVCGIISDQSPIQELIVVTKESKAYSQALQWSKKHAEQQKWRKELHERIIQNELKS